MAVTYLGEAEATDQLVTARLVGKPSGVASGDYAVFFLDRYDLGSSFPAVTAPSGVVLRGTVANARIETKVYLKKVASEINWNFSWSGSRWASLSVLFFRGPDPALDLSTVPFNTATGDGTAISATSVTTAAGAALAWNVNTHDYASTTTHVQPTGYTEVHEFDAYDTAYKVAAGSSESAASATNSVSQVWIAALVALQEASTAGPKDLDAKGSTAAAASGTTATDRPVASTGSAAANSTSALAADRPVAGQGTAAADTTAAVGAARAIAGQVASSAATVSAEATFERGLASGSGTGSAATSALSVTRTIDAGASTASGVAGSLVGGLKDLAGTATAATAFTGAASFTRGFDGSANAGSTTSNLLASTRPFVASAGTASDSLSDLSKLQSWYRLVVPQVVESYSLPDTNGALRASKVREVTVFGDESGLFTSELGAIPVGGDEYGAIPFGTKYIWYGGHVNITDDPAIRDLWLAYGFEVENVEVS